MSRLNVQSRQVTTSKGDEARALGHFVEYGDYECPTVGAPIHLKDVQNPYAGDSG